MLTARGAQPSQGLADHKALTARVLVCHARGEPRMRGVADVGVSSDPRLGATIAAMICGGGGGAVPLLGFFVVPVPPTPLNVEERRPRTPPEQDFHTGAVSGAKGTASTPNFGATLSDAQPTGAWCLYRQTPARATRFGSPDGLLQMAYLFQPPWAERMGLALQAGPAQGRA